MTILKKGFTLIELLIVMAILGVLAVVVLVAINPAEQMRRARDTGRISGVQQIGRAIAAYYTANGTLPPDDGSWGALLTTTEELQTIPAVINNADGLCTENVINGWCYSTDATEFFAVYSNLESEQRIQSCTPLTAAFAVYSSVDARGGVSGSAPTAGTQVDFCE